MTRSSTIRTAVDQGARTATLPTVSPEGRDECQTSPQLRARPEGIVGPRAFCNATMSGSYSQSAAHQHMVARPNADQHKQYKSRGW
jgi:hypothetical protein